MSALTPVSWGELVDKYTILVIKAERIQDEAKVRNVRMEMEALRPSMDEARRTAQINPLESRLKVINEKLWVIEDEIRDCERVKDFGPRFVELARSVYFTNDERAAVKRLINEALGSAIVEEEVLSGLYHHPAVILFEGTLGTSKQLDGTNPRLPWETLE